MRFPKMSCGAYVVACFLGLFPGRAELHFRLESASTSLSPESTGQRVTVWIENQGSESVPVLGGTFHFQIEDGSEVGTGPRILGVDFPDQTPSLFRRDNASLALQAFGSRIWSAIVITQPESLPIEAWILPFQRLALATLTLATQGTAVNSSPWRLRMRGTSQGDSILDRIDPEDRGMVLSVVPVVSDMLLTLGPGTEQTGMRVGLLASGHIEISIPIPLGSEVKLERSTAIQGQPWDRVEVVPDNLGSALRWKLPPDEGVSQTFYRIVLSP
jgi:hypothetical protein